MASRTTAPRNETSKLPMLSTPELMDGAPTRGPINHPPSIAPMMPTTMFRKMPWLPSRRITMLASQPTTPPITNQRISPIIFSLVHACVTLALVRVQFVVESLQTAAEHVGRTSLVALEMFERCKNEGALDLIERRANRETNFVVGMRAGGVAQRRHFLLVQRQFAVTQDVRTLNGIAQFAHVAGPVMTQESRAQCVGHALARAVAQVELAQEKIRQH